MSATATPTTKATTMTAHRAELNGLRSPFIELAGDRWIHLPRPKLLRLRRVLRLTEQPLIWPQSMQAGPYTHIHTHTHIGTQSGCLLTHLCANYGSAATANGTGAEAEAATRHGPPPGLGHKIWANHRLIAPHNVGGPRSRGHCGCHGSPSLSMICLLVFFLLCNMQQINAQIVT